MGKFDGLLSGFNSSFFPTIAKGREAGARKQQAAAAQKLAQDRLGLQQDAFGLQEEQFRTGQADKQAAADQKLTSDLGQALNIQKAVDTGRSSGTLSEADVTRINAGVSGAEQSALLNSITAENQEVSRNAPIQDLEQQRLLAGIESDQALTQQRTAAAGAEPAKPNDIRLLAELGLEPTLENLAQVRSAGGAQKSQAPIKVGPDQVLVDPSTGKEIYKAPSKPKGSEATSAQRNATSVANVSYSALESNLTKLRDLVEEHGAEVSSGKVRDKMQMHEQTAMLEAKELFKLGVLSGPDLDILKSLMVSPTPDRFSLSAIPAAVKEGAAALGMGESLGDRSIASIGSFLDQAKERVNTVRKESGDAPLGGDDDGFVTSAGGNKYKVVK